MDKKKELDILHAKIQEGLELTFINLVKQKSIQDEDLIFSVDNKIVRVKAREFLNNKNPLKSK